jgi:hypothetical protein
MSVPRTDIRTAAKNALLGATAAGQAVFTSKYTALMSETFPLILISAAAEELESAQVQPAQYFRKLKLILSALVQANDSMDDVLDLVGSQVEAAMAKDPTLAGSVTGMVLKAIDLEAIEGEQLFGAIHLTYEVGYFG